MATRSVPANNAAEALHEAALVAAQQRHFLEAIDLLRRALCAQPDRWSWLSDLGVAQYAAGQWAHSADSLTRAARGYALSAANLRLLASAWLKAGCPEQAASVYREALERDPACARSLCGLGQALRRLGDLAGCLEALEQSLAIDPELIAARRELAEIYGTCRFHFLDLEERRQIVALDPDDPDAQMWFGRASFQTGDTATSVMAMRKVVECNAPPELCSEFLGMLLHDPSQNGLTLRREHEHWAARFAGRVTRSRYDQDREPERRLRLGYLCADFCSGPSHDFLMPLLRHRRRDLFHLTCYHTGPKSDETTEYRRETDCWREVSSAGDEDLCRLIAEDGIDLLVDLSGHYEGHRLGVFARRPAPVQATFPYYPCTTGVSGIRYIFTDRWVCPRVDRGQYTETPVWIEPGYMSYLPPSGSGAPRVAADSGPITFGIFQRPAKCHPGFWDLVAAVLEACPTSTLLVQQVERELDIEGSRARQTILSMLSDRSIRPGRVRFQGPVRSKEIMKLYAEADIALDTFPYNGQATTCACLWMGVPVVTMAGRHHVARVGHSIVSRIGFAELSARDNRDYVERAVSLARDRRRLQETCSRLRVKAQASSLVNGKSVVALEDQYRNLWRSWCNSES